MSDRKRRQENTNTSGPSGQKRQRRDDSPADRPSIDDYTIGLICTLQCEYDALCRMLCEEFEGPDQVDNGDNNTYILGRIENHDVVVACPPAGRQGNNSAARVARDMARSFPHIRFVLLIGIGGGAPSSRHDILLGDVVVSMPHGKSCGVVKYDAGKRLPDGNFEIVSQLNSPPELLLGVMTDIRRRHRDPTKMKGIATHMERMNDMPDYQRPMTDNLFRADYRHPVPGRRCGESCGVDGMISRPVRPQNREIELHYGAIGCGDSVIKDAMVRDTLSDDSNYNILCFEMEAAGLMNQFPCLVIRGISDYADSHKNDDWHNFAALSAAAFARELLTCLKPCRVAGMPRWATKLQESIDKIHTELNELNSQINKDRIYEWLSPPDSYENYARALATRQPGTANWILKYPEFENWKSKKGSFLWISGIPGSGKTVLASSIIEHIAQFTNACTASSTKTALIYFYFDFSDTKKQSRRSLVCSLIWQMIDQADCIGFSSTVLDRNFHSCGDGRNEPSEEQLWEILYEFVEMYEDVFIVLDAEDESTEPIATLEFISAFFDTWRDKLHMLVTSRTESEMNPIFSRHLPCETVKIMMHKDPVTQDIAQYVQHRLQMDKELEKWIKIPHKRRSIERIILEKCDGMFRLAICHLDDLRKALNANMLDTILEQLPQTLEEIYYRIISTIDDRHRHYALIVLVWLVHAKKPITIAELIDVLAVDLAKNLKFDERNRFMDHRDILTICSRLVVVEKNEDIDSSIVRLSHASVRDYLLSQSFESHFGGMMKSENANSGMTSLCLSYLLELEDVKEDFVSSTIYSKFPLMAYATTHWIHHARLAMKGHGVLRKLMMKFMLDMERAFDLWVQLYEDVPPSSNSSSKRLYYACLARSVECVKLLLEKGVEPNAFSYKCGTPLECCVIRNFEEITNTLLDCGAKPDFTSDRQGYQTPLQMAVGRGFYSIALQLLRHGANPNFQIPQNHDPLPLSMAIRDKDVEMARLLLDHGADPNTRHEGTGATRMSALQFTSRIGNFPLVQLLLEKGANPQLNHQGSCGTPLDEALYHGHHSIAELLCQYSRIEKGTIHENPQMRLALGGHLENSAYYGRYECVKLLLDHVFSQDSPEHEYHDLYGVALWMACSQGHIQIVALVIERCRYVTEEFLDLARKWTPQRFHESIFPLLTRLGRISEL